jgi:predicted TIM-barrel fold metal-dependent hydrolase
MAAELSAAKPAAVRDAPDPLLAAACKGQSLVDCGFEIIDAHGHLGPYRNFYIPDPSAEGIVSILDRCGVSRASIASHLAIGPDWILGNRLTAEAVAEYPDRLIGHAVANPHQPELIRAELAYAFDELGLRAIKLHPDMAAYSILGEGYRPAWEFAAERGCLVLCHTYHGSRFCDPQVFGQLAERYPQVPVLLVHSGALTAGFEGAIRLVKQYPNLYLDLSGSFITGAWIARMVREAGADRVVFSSDIPFIDLRYGLGRVLTAGLAEAEARLVLGGNILRLLHL